MKKKPKLGIFAETTVPTPVPPAPILVPPALPLVPSEPPLVAPALPLVPPTPLDITEKRICSFEGPLVDAVNELHKRGFVKSLRMKETDEDPLTDTEQGKVEGAGNAQSKAPTLLDKFAAVALAIEEAEVRRKQASRLAGSAKPTGIFKSGPSQPKGNGKGILLERVPIYPWRRQSPPPPEKPPKIDVDHPNRVAMLAEMKSKIDNV